MTAHWPLLAALGLYLAITISFVVMSLGMNQGRLIYPLDDTYIHMAIARNAALYQVWGVTPDAFTSSTSSPLWTALLAGAYALFGVQEATPLLLNLCFGVLTVIVAYSLLQRFLTSRRMIAALLLITILSTPLPSLTIAGMEHVLHALLTLVFLALASRLLADRSAPLRGSGLALLLLAPLLASIRYEGLFLVFIVCCLLVVQRRLVLALLLGGAALAPIIAYGSWSLSNGWMFLPNSLLIKSQATQLGMFGVFTPILAGIGRLTLASHILALFLACLVLLRWHRIRRAPMNERTYAAMLFVGVVPIHMMVSSTGWFYRYEAYLQCAGFILVGLFADDMLPWFRQHTQKREQAFYYAQLLLLLSVLSFGYRSIDAIQTTPYAMHDRFLGHIQVAEFLQTYYNHDTIVMNDIGAAAFFTDARIIDLYGLGNMEPYLFRQDPSGYTKYDVEAWIGQRGAPVAILQIQWSEVQPLIPDTWELLGIWRSPRNVIFGDTTIGMFAVEPQARDLLLQRLHEYTSQLPGELQVELRARE